MSPRHARSRPIRFLLAAGLAAAVLAAPGAVGPTPPSAVHAASLVAAARSYPATIAAGRIAAQKALADSGASSLSLALVDAGRIVWHETFGTIDAAGTKPVEATMYGLGSVSKTVLAVGLMRLVDAGRIRLDAPVVDYVPDFRMASPEYRRITVRMLLDHTAGLPGSDYANAMTTAPYDGYQEQLLRGLRTERLKTTPGAMSVYCNDCYTLAEIVVQRVAGRPYVDYVADEVFAPLGMTHSRFPTAAFPAGSYAPVVTDEGVKGQEYLSLPGSGSVYSTPVDMSRLATMLMSGGIYRGTRILSAWAVGEMGRLQIATTLDPVQDNEWLYGLGWDSVREAGLAAVGVQGWVKGGDSTDYHAGFTLAPRARLAAVVQFAGTTVSSGQAETLGQTFILRALVERGDLKAMPKVLGETTLPQRKPTAAQLAAIEGIYPAGGNTFRITAGPDGSIRLSRLLEGAWQDMATFTLRSDGRFWETSKRMKSLYTVDGWGRHYLVIRGPGGYGHYRTDTILGERLDPGGPLSAAWKGRLGKTYVLASEVAVSIGWDSPAMTFVEIPGLQGYLIANVAGNPVPIDPGTSDTLGAMTVVIPAMQGRDLSDVDVLARDGEEWLRMGSTLVRPLATAPTAAKGSTSVTIADGAVAEWVKVTADGAVTTAGADGWKTFDAGAEPLASGTGDAKGVEMKAGTYIVVFAAAGKKVAVTID